MTGNTATIQNPTVFAPPSTFVIATELENVGVGEGRFDEALGVGVVVGGEDYGIHVGVSVSVGCRMLPHTAIGFCPSFVFGGEFQSGVSLKRCGFRSAGDLAEAGGDGGV